MPEHTVEALVMRVTPQANITDGTGTTIPVTSAEHARKVLARTARLHAGAITVTQHGYDPADPTAGTTLAVGTDGRVEEHEAAGPGPCWEVEYHSWVVDVDHEGSYNVPGLPTAMGDARMLATRLNRPVIVHVADIRPDNQKDTHTLVEPEPEPEPEHEPEQEPELDVSDIADQRLVVPMAVIPVQESIPMNAPDPESGQALVSADSGEGPGADSAEPGPESLAVAASADGLTQQTPPSPARLAKQRRRILLTALSAAVLLAGGVATTSVLSLGNAAPEQEQTASPGPTSGPEWAAATTPREVSVAAHGVLVTAGSGKVEVFSLADGKPIGTGTLPEGRPRVVAAAAGVFAIVAGNDGTNAGFFASPGGVKDFAGIKGTLVTRGSEPFFLTGSGKDQGALVWDGTTWKPAAAPEPGMAPVAASTAGVLWLGTNNRLVSATTSATLTAPAPGSKTAGWVRADDRSVALLWDTPNGRVLALHSIADGKITGQAPAGGTDFHKDGDLIVSGTRVFRLDSGAPVPVQACADPVPAGGLLWCGSENTWTAPDARPLAPGESPVPSPADLVVTATDNGFAAYNRDEMKSAQTQEEK